MKYAIVGFGTCGGFWRDAILHTGGVLSAVCDPKSVCSEDGVMHFDSVDDFVQARVPCDYVIVASPVSTHRPMCEQLLRGGYDIIVEKPVSYSLTHVDEIRKIAKSTGRQALCAYHAAFGTDVEYFLRHRESLEEGMGRLVSFVSEFFDPYMIDGVLLDSTLSLHGSYLDSGINAISVLARIFDPDNIHCSSFHSDLLLATTLSSDVTYRCEDVEGRILTDWTRGVNMKRTELVYEGGRIFLNHTKQCIEKTVDMHTEVIAPDTCGNKRILNQYSNMIGYIKRGEFELFSDDIYDILLGRP